MDQSNRMLVIGKDGLRGVIEQGAQSNRAGEPQVLVRFADGQQMLVPSSALVLRDDGSYYLPIGPQDLRRQPAQNDLGAGETIVLPVIAEELNVQKRTVETGGVRVSKVVREREEVVDEPLLREEVAIERVPIGRAIAGPVEVRQEGDTLIIPIVEEVLVVEKRLMLKEELRVTRRQIATSTPQTVTLRSEEAIVERIEPRERAHGAGKDHAE